MGEVVTRPRRMTLAPAILFDRDGTLASCFKRPTDRSNSAWAEFNASLCFDAPVPLVAGILRSIRPGVTRIMVSGRAEGDWPGDRRRRFLMQDWIAKNDLPIDELYMRTGGDGRVDSVVKHEILHRDLLPHWDIRYAIDDRQSIVDVWREHGIPTLHVTDPELEPWIARQS